MKINELMIGDWVMTTVSITKGHSVDYPDKIVAIRDNIGLVEVESDGRQKTRFSIAPIPLTAEILEKNGFWRKHNVGYVMEKDEYEIIYSLWDHNLRILKNREQILNLEYLDEMCVHELQHALLLCGIDKEIEL